MKSLKTVKIYIALSVMVFAATCIPARAQFDGFPPFPRHSRDAAGFIPDNWVVIDQCRADLNGDGYPDVALAVQSPEPRTDSRGREEYPKMLIVALFDTHEGQYIVKGYSTGLLNPPNRQMTHNSFRELSCDRDGRLTITLDYIWSAGTYSTTETRYSFIYSGEGFRLARIDSYGTGPANVTETRQKADLIKGRFEATIRSKGVSKSKSRRISYRIEKQDLDFDDVSVGLPGPGLNAQRKGSRR